MREDSVRFRLLITMSMALLCGVLLVPSHRLVEYFAGDALKLSSVVGGKAQAQSSDRGSSRRFRSRQRVTFNLEDAELQDLVRLVSEITGRRFILPSKLKNVKATVYATNRVTAAEAYRAFLSVLEMNGLTVIPSGRYYKIVETSGIESRPIPLIESGSAVPLEDRFMTRLHRLQNVTADDVVELLNRFKSAEGNVSAYAPTNMLILTDTGTNIRRMLRMIEVVDIPRSGEQIWIEPIHYADAQELAARLQEIFPVGESNDGPNNRRKNNANQAEGNDTGSSLGIRKILADERTNSLIVVSAERGYLQLLEMVRRLDIPLEGEGGIHVHYLQHSDSEEIAKTLSNLIGGRQGAAGGRRNQNNAPPSPTDPVFEGQIRVTAHAPSNALVITSSMHDYVALRRVIDRLDMPRRQVFIEAVIMELSVSRARRFGVSFHGGLGDVLEEGSLALAGSGAGNTLPQGGQGLLPAAFLTQDALTGLAVGLQGPIIDEIQTTLGVSIPSFGVALTAVASSGDTNVLATPHIIAMDNEQAEISIGANIPLQTNGVNLGALAGGAAVGGAAGLGGLAGLGGIGNAPRQDVGTTIRVTPHINESEQIRLEVEEEISEALPDAEGSLGVRSFNKRNAKTQLVVHDQQTVVIGGLMRDRTSTQEQKVPILGDIPILGLLFKRTRKQTEKTNLLLFLTPYIIRDDSDLRRIYERKMQERQEFLDRYFVFNDDDYKPHVDFTRTRGLVSEIINELDDMERRREMLRAVEDGPALGHEPQHPLGAEAHVGYNSERAEDDLIVTPSDEPADGAGQTTSSEASATGSVEENPGDASVGQSSPASVGSDTAPGGTP